MNLKIFVSIIFLVLAFLSFEIYRALYPFEEFYVEEWCSNTDLPFPKSSNIIWKTATYPDQHGDYTSTAIIKLPALEFIKLKTAIHNSIILTSDSLYNGYKGIFNQYLPNELQKKPPFKDYHFSSIKAFFKIGFNESNNTIVFQRH